MISASIHENRVLPIGVLLENGFTEDHFPGRAHLLTTLTQKLRTLIGREVSSHVVLTADAFRSALRKREYDCVALVCANVHDRMTEGVDLARNRPFTVFSPNGDKDEFFTRAYCCLVPIGHPDRNRTKTFRVASEKQICLKKMQDRPNHSVFRVLPDDFGDYVLLTFLRKNILPCPLMA